ncbi:magnesium transporter CorA family protein [Planomonospora sp. ID91781]|uniref:Magnesium transporter CorA n=3 Tax=Planomonospora TaxID=1998 RepID=A0A171DBU4_9ACTN|nr:MULTISPECIES: magnesium transporter CorA family protein [Planomonospora]MBG0820221.1 magnesium transporter CorA family protein [Planomonospora sp. ID91781]GAT67939.1 magnesium transporter CorA [Planomonospora sphaerica]GGK80607.1 magnesium transporter CorA [Planomonospora parontospora]GII11355.1 magnesium transporter CorA [Planomonospora parontospora subsp. parontospora]
MDRTRLYRDGVLVRENFPIDDVSECVAEPGAVVWFDLCAPTAADLAKISEELGLHELAVEDALHDRQRPKLDTYDSHLFITVYAARLVEGRIELTELSVFVTENALVTVRDGAGFDIEGVLRRWDANAAMARYGVAYLLHGLLDHIVDGYFEVLQPLDDRIEELEDELFDGVDGDLRVRHRQTFELRKTLVQFRRLAMPMREVVGTLLRRGPETVDPVLIPYYQDVYDHILRAAEWTDSLRELVGNIREAHQNQQGFKLNEIMKKVTSWAAIIAVPTLITGFYGQNVPYPGSGEPVGFWVSTALIVTGTALLYRAFRRRDWL